jgi:hypothetical protein
MGVLNLWKIFCKTIIKIIGWEEYRAARTRKG